MKAEPARRSTSALYGTVLSVGVPVLSLVGALAMAAGLGPPIADAPATSSAADGRVLFVQSCAHCHGDDASGSGEDGDGPDLRGLRISKARIATVIRQGIHGEMPSFAKKYSGQDVAALVEYLRRLR